MLMVDITFLIEISNGEIALILASFQQKSGCFERSKITNLF
jgi:hypothetical protein